MKQILKFDLNPQDIKIKKILDKEFLELEIYAISDIYPNRNRSAFTESSMEESKNTCYNKPILGCFNVLTNDFEEHNSETKFDPDLQQEYEDYTSNKSEKILGVIRESDTVEIVEKDGQKWLKIGCILWTMYTYKQVKKMLQSKSKKVSVEVLVVKSHTDEDGILVIDRFILTGITILGDKVSEGIPNAHLNILDLMQQKDFSSQVKCLSFAYKEDVQLDNMSDLHINTLQTEGTQVTYREKLDFLNSRLAEVYSCGDERCCGCFWICDFADDFVIIRDYHADKYFKIPYTIDAEDTDKVTFDLEGKIEQMQTFKDFVEKTIEFEGEQKTIEDFHQMYSESVTNYGQLEETYNQYKEEMSQKVFTITIDETEYDINQLQEKFNADLATKDGEIQSYKENIEGLQGELSTAKTDLETMTTNFNTTSEELNTLKQTMKEAQEEQIRTEGLKLIQSETDIADEDRTLLEQNCNNNQYSSIQAVEDDIAKAVYKLHKSKKQTNSFQSNIVHSNVGNTEDKKSVFDRLNDYSIN